MSKIEPTKEELLATLRHSNLPTVLIEGYDDIIFYRRVEQEFNNFKIDMLPAGGKQTVLWLKNELRKKPVNIQVACIVDQDTWVNFGIPDDIDDVITTYGYSVENDLYIDGDFEKLLLDDEARVFKHELSLFIYWYALALFRHTQSHDGEDLCSYREHPNNILDNNYDNHISLNKEEIYPEELRKDIEDNYKLKLRGKSLIYLLMRRLSSKNRIPKHNHKQLMDIAAARKGNNYIRLVNLLKDRFGILT